MPRKQNGFTLIELSITLIIIGLLVGGILLGRDMVKSAEIRRQISQFGEFDVAIKTFRLKYNNIPGDMSPAEATAYGLPAHPGWNSRGNGIVDDLNLTYPPVSLFQEPLIFFSQLGDAGLIKGKYSLPFGHYSYQPGEQFAGTKIGSGGIFVYSKADTSLSYFFGLNRSIIDGSTWLVASLSTAGIITPGEAYALDAKMDDGLPVIGHIRSATIIAGKPNYDTTNGNCSTASTNLYKITNTNPDCRLVVDVR
jgi:prepilin-type N-terminal cleavage/methylation domain-containing protein